MNSVILKVQVVTATPYQQNCSVIWCTEIFEGAVIDPGGDIDRIINVVDQHQINVVKILLTHGHLDHAGGATKLARELNIPIIGPQKGDQFWLDGMEMQGQSFGLPSAENCTPDQWLEGGEDVQVGNETLSVFHCPGHTPGHIIFHHKDTALAFVGDVLFKGSIGRTDFPRGDHATLIQSITSKLWPLGGETRFISGHGEISDFATERATNPFVGDNALA